MFALVVTAKLIEAVVIDVHCINTARNFHSLWRMATFGGGFVGSAIPFLWYSLRRGPKLRQIAEWFYFAFVVWRRLHPNERLGIIDHLPHANGKIIRAWEHFNQEKHNAWVRATGQPFPILVDYGFGFYGVL